ncbi:YXWGXW repeat-containing protein [Sphingomonas sp. GlSt437]|uniref:YXWGXW repeat-containing protein n=2 Tax=Sphingomonas sp. GlSt437 TaxID=3389970 RepID=UPI003EBB5796
MILLAAAAMPLSAAPAQAQVFVNVSVRFSPPPLPVYEQPPLPGPDYIWLPGYWAWDDLADDYFWVPGTWALAPRPGYVWTPPWWGWSDGAYVFHSGYWGQHIGWYGGIVYGFGYTGFGYEGGFWRGPHYVYNRAVTNITNVNVTNVYNKTVIVNRTTINNISFNGGPGGVHAQPTATQLAAAREPHLAPTAEQQRHIETARGAPQLFAAANHGAPPVAATLAPARLNGPGVVRARAAGGPLGARPAVASPAGRPPVGGPPTARGNAAPGYVGAYGGRSTPTFADRRPFADQPLGRAPSVHVHEEGRPEPFDATLSPRPSYRPPVPQNARADRTPPQHGEAVGGVPRPVVAAAPVVHHLPADRAPPRPPAPPHPQPRPEQHVESHRPPAEHSQPREHDHPAR